MQSSDDELSTLLSKLPKQTWRGGIELYNWEGFWYRDNHLSAAMAARSSFQARDDDVFLASSMKTGTTWLKALIPTIINPKGRSDDDGDDPLLKHHPNELVPSLEIQIFKDSNAPRRDDQLSAMSSPRLFRTHVPYPMLPESVVNNSACKLVYITRDPKDTFVSLWKFLESLDTGRKSNGGGGRWPMNEAFESFVNGVHAFGPFHDHVLSYWEESLRQPTKILFLRYEDMKKDPKGEVTKLACFLGRPFEKEEVVEKVMWRCSLERLKSMEVNKHRADPWVGIDYRLYFRRGEVGDWENHLSEEMKQRLDQVTRIKFQGSGLDRFGYY